MTRRHDPSSGHPGRSRRLAGTAFLALGSTFAMLSVGDQGVAQEAIGLEGTRAALEQMVEARRVISREKADWALGRELLDARLDVVRTEIDGLRSLITDTEARISETDRQRDELVAENELLKSSSASLAELVTSLETRTATLLPALPEPIRERVKPLSQQFAGGTGDEGQPEDAGAEPTGDEPDTAAKPELSLAVRLQNVIGVLNEINKFNRDVTVHSEVREVSANGVTQKVSVAAVYVGIAYGYYASVDGRFAGSGTVADGVWTWTPRNEAAPAIQQAIAILQGEAVADFVQLPITID